MLRLSFKKIYIFQFYNLYFSSQLVQVAHTDERRSFNKMINFTQSV